MYVAVIINEKEAINIRGKHERDSREGRRNDMTIF